MISNNQNTSLNVNLYETKNKIKDEPALYFKE